MGPKLALQALLRAPSKTAGISRNCSIFPFCPYVKEIWID